MGVFANLPDVMCMDMKRKGSRWYSNCRLDGSVSTRWDKLNCRLVDRGVQLLEQGGESMTLWGWLLAYGGCETNKDVVDVLLGYQGAITNNGWMIEKDEPLRYVQKKRVFDSVVFRQTHGNGLSLWLEGLFGKDRVKDALDLYLVGAEPEGLCVFWNIDSLQKVCHDKGMAYMDDGHRDKSRMPLRYWRKKDGYTGRCLFGEHLLGKDVAKKVYVVESEKTAILSHLFFGDGCWLATGGQSAVDSLKTPKNAIFLPDVDSYDYWSEKYGSENVIKWWEYFEGYDPSPKDDIGDYIVWKMMKYAKNA